MLQSAMMEILRTNRGGTKLHLEGYLYVRKRDLADGGIRWQCEKQRSESCSGAIFSSYLSEPLNKTIFLNATNQAEIIKIVKSFKSKKSHQGMMVSV